MLPLGPMRILSALVLALALALSSPRAIAGPQEKAIALELVKLVTPRESYRDMLKQMTDNMAAAMAAKSGGSVPPDRSEKLVAALEDALPYDDLIEWTADIYSSRFTAAELKDLLKF